MKNSKIDIYNLKHDYWDYLYVVLLLLLAFIIYYHTTHWIAFIVLLFQLLKVRMIMKLFKERKLIASIDSKSIAVFNQTFDFNNIGYLEIRIKSAKKLDNKVDLKINKTQDSLFIGEFEYFKLTSLLQNRLKPHQLNIIDSRTDHKKDILKDYRNATIMHSFGMIAIISMIASANNSYERFSSLTIERGTNARAFDMLIYQLDKFGGRELTMQFLTCLLLIFAVWFIQKITIYLAIKKWKRIYI